MRDFVIRGHGSFIWEWWVVQSNSSLLVTSVVFPASLLGQDWRISIVIQTCWMTRLWHVKPNQRRTILYLDTRRALIFFFPSVGPENFSFSLSLLSMETCVNLKHYLLFKIKPEMDSTAAGKTLDISRFKVSLEMKWDSGLYYGVSSQGS